ncbi:SspB family protein [Pedomonas mirosovicensis]|uniref:SspB family protein n=1 Tax=Pedomonas mirosovicensis TaxID=2908641 RepID=UPI0021699290|nr:ClpXP protease specificity-enhancing factor SspB [Pedomonas mirosovicensis]MCH8686003.1 ClpXP protease specificity-enhancing factor SspB [Pedomonas mirosovicensis]
MVTTESLIPYEDYVQAALRSVVARVLKSVEAGGLPGQHHFYIAFKTRYPGVILPKALLEKYPDEITIVLQNRYWDLHVHEDRFEVSLSFNQVPSHIVVPYAALVGFVDPAVNFGLQFQPPEAEAMPQAVPDEVSPVEVEAPAEAAPQPASEAPGEGGSNVITLDRFRKKS